MLPRLRNSNLVRPIGQALRLDRTHPLAVGMTIAYLFNEAAAHSNSGSFVTNYANPTLSGTVSGGSTHAATGRGVFLSGGDITPPVGEVTTGILLTKAFTICAAVLPLN